MRRKTPAVLVGSFALMLGNPACYMMATASPIDRAAVELNCARDQIRVVRSATYTGGGVYVLDACGQQASYECMGTVCQKACSASPKPSEYTGAGETDGSFHSLAVKRAAAEFGCAAENTKQVRHADSVGGGFYVMSVCGQEVRYNCAGTVCNLACN